MAPPRLLSLPLGCGRLCVALFEEVWQWASALKSQKLVPGSSHSASFLWVRCKLSPLLQHHACLPATLTIDSPSETGSNAFFNKLPWF